MRLSSQTRFLALWIAATLAATVAFVSHLAVRYECSELGYDVGKARKVLRDLEERKRLLAIEAATLSSTERIERVARRNLEMDIPAQEQMRAVGRKIERRASGRIH